jgi:maleamate amidohydrolase
MTKRIWDAFLTERDRQVFAASGFGAQAGFGARPAILVVDVTYNFVGDRREPILDSIKRWPNSCGEDAWDALPRIRRLLDAGRAKGIPVLYTRGTMREDGWDGGSWWWKIARLDETATRVTRRRTDLDGNQIVAEVAPQPQDIVIEKHKPSVFHGTPLQSFLVLLQADSLIMCGTTTSGCVRATVLDAFSNNYRVSIVEEGCFDRSQASHALSLCDMNAKYADIVKLDQTLAFIETLPPNLFELPKGVTAASLRAVG